MLARRGIWNERFQAGQGCKHSARFCGRFWATDDRCTHDGGQLVAGRLEGYTIICPRHGARFDIRTGEVLSRPASVDLAVHEVKVQGEDVLVRISEDL